jgi:glycosyltransferase involved in cell wall biosynthesis
VNILLTVFDLYRTTGGGQTSYRAIIENRPNDRFYYFVHQEALDAPRPHNTTPIPYRELVQADDPSRFFSQTRALLSALYTSTLNIAACAKAHLGSVDFDVVDCPDFHQYGVFVRPAMEQVGIRVEAVALGLYGVLTNSFLSNWASSFPDTFKSRLKNPIVNVPYLHLVERMQYRAADVVYTCVGEPYMRRWQAYKHRSINFFDPLVCVPRVIPSHTTGATSQPVDLCFIGRRERIKGPDLFVDLVGWTSREKYGRAIIVGPDAPNSQGVGSGPILEGMARRRRVDLDIRAHLPAKELRDTYTGRTLVVLPSRFDTLNFVALEALALGCPALISDRAGVVSYLQRYHPKIPFWTMDIRCSRTAASTVTDLADSYDARRAELNEAIAHHGFAPDISLTADIYRVRDQIDVDARSMISDTVGNIQLFRAPRPAIQQSNLRKFAQKLPQKQLAYLKSGYSTLSRYQHFLRNSDLRAISQRVAIKMIKSRLGADAAKHRLVQYGGSVPRTHAYAGTVGERQKKQVYDKIRTLKELIATHPIDRITYFRELARLERRIGHSLIAATYQLRIIRWLNRDAFGDLPAIMHTLQRHGYTAEAETANAMYSPGIDNDAACAELLEKRYNHARTIRTGPLERIDDRRNNAEPVVSIIVSMYRAESKLRSFLRMINADLMLQDGRAELILVDSGSPTNEYTVFREVMEKSRIPVVYIRSIKRETIQSAWNRGIMVARSRYLTFLGVDEAMPPHGTAELAKALDANPSVDWVVSDTIVTDVNRNHVFVSDVMMYDRASLRDWSHYLDCTFINFVGCMYRRSLHDRHGYYDPTFRAAGDNEFKNRVLPHVRCGYVPKMLGIFNNYPEDRATQGPQAELEDLRAWYLHRTPAGMRYAFAEKGPEQAEQLLAASLRYRKTYLPHLSSDIDLARSLATSLENRKLPATYLPDFEQMLQIFRSVERYFPGQRTNLGLDDGSLYEIELVRKIRELRKFAIRHKSGFGLSGLPVYDILNDNRYEQHSWTW